jgi:hypothetical protein
MQVLLLALFLTVSAAGATDDVSGPGEFKTEAEKLHLIRTASERWATVRSWLIEYDVFPSVKKDGPVPVHRIVAVSATGELYHLGAHFPPLYPWQADPHCQEFFIHQGRTCHRWPFNRIYVEGSIKPGEEISGSFSQDLLLAIVPRWPITDYRFPISRETRFMILPPEAVASPEYRLRSKLETIGGEPCAVFERDGIDRIWVAVEKGFCVVRRDILVPGSTQLLERILVERTSQVAPGLWLAKEFRCQFFAPKPGAMQPVVDRASEVRIARCLLNEDVPDSTFVPRHAAGSLRYDKAGSFVQASPGGTDLLEKVVNFAVEYAHLPSKTAGRGVRLQRLLMGFVSGIGIGFCLPGLRGSRSHAGARQLDRSPATREDLRCQGEC